MECKQLSWKHVSMSRYAFYYRLYSGAWGQIPSAVTFCGVGTAHFFWLVTGFNPFQVFLFYLNKLFVRSYICIVLGTEC
jgi:hypothetical protein